MRLSVERARWGLIAGAALLVLIVGAYLGYGRYRALKRWKTILQRSGATITHDTNGFTYSQALKGRTVFTLHAAKATEHADGTWSLHDAELTLYSRTSERADHIYGAEFEYDPKEGVAKALGEVHMDLEAPQGFAGGSKVATPQRIRGKEGRAPSALRSADEGMQTIHVRTSGLVYVRSLGVAATQEDVEFSYGDVECHAHGAEFEQGESTVHLLAAVRMNGTLRGQPILLTAAKADLDRANNLAALSVPVINTPGHTVSAGSAVLRLRKDGSVQSADAQDAVTLVAGTQTVRAAHLEATMAEDSEPQTAKLSGGVVVDDTNETRPLHAAAQEIDASFDSDGEPQIVTASGGANLLVSDRTAVKSGLSRSISGDKIVITLAHSGDSDPHLTEIHAIGQARAQGESVVAGRQPGRRTTSVAADDLRASFAASDRNLAEVQRLLGDGHTQLQQQTTLGELQTSKADTLDVTFAPVSNGAKSAGDLQVASAVQAGHVVIHTKAAPEKDHAATESAGSSERATYDGATQELSLSGHVSLAQNGTELAASKVVLAQATGNAEAFENVTATLRNSASNAQSQPSHVTADRAEFSHGSQMAEFFGTDAHPARLWQEASQVQAALLTMDGQAKTLTARPLSALGLVSAVFASQSKKEGNIVHVSSPRMDYSDALHEAVFAGGVKMQTETGTIKAQRAVAFLKTKTQSTTATPSPSGIAGANPFAGSIDRVIASNAVRLEQPGRTGTGEQLLYTAASDSFVLTGTPGNPPHITDSQQGSVTGATLLFGASDSTIIVAGTPGDSKRTRVRTETDVKP